ncbi:uncharacterized protein LOC144107413 [Amblyomma americanum]
MWTVRLNGVPEDVTPKAVCINGKVYSFNSGFEPRNFVDVFIFDPVSHRCQAFHCLSARTFSFVYNETLYILGGCIDVVRIHFADVHQYDTETSYWTEVRPCGSGPSGRYWHGCSVMGERVIIFGGLGLAQEEGPPNAAAITGMTEPCCKMWTVRLNGVPEDVTPKAVCINGKVYSFNSGFEPRNFVDVFIFDPASHRWDMQELPKVAEFLQLLLMN